MSEIIKNRTERKYDISIDKIFEVYGENGNNLAPKEVVMDLSLEPKKAEEWTLEALAKAKLDNKLTALVAGSFDVPHPNHDWFLRHCRLMLADKWLKNNDINTKEMTEKEQGIILREVIESDRIFLAVSIDTDTALDIRKSNDPTKGGVKRPIYDWGVRANRIASQSFASSLDPRIKFGVVDLVVAGGPEYKDTILEKAKILADTAHNQYDLIDEYIVFDEHPQDIDNAINSGFEPIIIPMDYIYSKGPNGEKHKSSAYIRKIRGED